MEEFRAIISSLMNYFKNNKPVFALVVFILLLMILLLSINVSENRKIQSISATSTVVAQWNATNTVTTKWFSVDPTLTAIAKITPSQTPIPSETPKPTETQKPTAVPEKGLNVSRDKVSKTVGIKLEKKEPIDSLDNYSGRTNSVVLQVIGPSSNVREIGFTLFVNWSQKEENKEGMLKLLYLMSIFGDDAYAWVKDRSFQRDKVEEATFNGITFQTNHEYAFEVDIISLVIKRK